VPYHELTSLQVEISSACNLNCNQCFKHIDGHKSGFFPVELWETRILTLLSQLQDIYLVGIGEPTLSKDFIRYIKDAKKAGVTVHSTSNLQLVNEMLADQIVTSGLDNLSFSCDGAREATYESIRTNGTLDNLKKSLNLINEAKHRHKSLLPDLILNFGATKRNIVELHDVLIFAKVHHVGTIVAFHNIAYFPELKEESLFHEQELSDECFLRAKALADKLGIVMLFPGLFSQPIKYVSADLYCRYPMHYLYIYHDGRVGPCCMDFPDRYILGNINHHSIEEIWNDRPILQLRKTLKTDTSVTCRFCSNHSKMDISDPRYLFRFNDCEEYLETLLVNKN